MLDYSQFGGGKFGYSKVPQAADYLATLEGVDTAIVYGIVHDAIHLSTRSPDPRLHAGILLEEAFAGVGSAGGHHNMAGGEIPLGIFADHTTDDAQFLPIVEDVVTGRLLARLNMGDESES